MDFVIGFFCEVFHLSFTLGQHGKSRRLHSPDGQLLSVLNRKKSCGIDTDKPIGFGTTLCGRIKTVIIAPGAKIVKAITDSAIFHRTDPQAKHGFLALGKLVCHTKNGFSLTPCIASVDNALHILSVHEFF